MSTGLSNSILRFTLVDFRLWEATSLRLMLIYNQDQSVLEFSRESNQLVVYNQLKNRSKQINEYTIYENNIGQHLFCRDDVYFSATQNKVH